MVKKLRLKEDLDPNIPSWLRDAIRKTKGWLGKTGPSGDYEVKSRTIFGNVSNLDLENTTYHELPIPRTSREFNQIMDADDKVAVMRGEDENGDVFVYAGRVNNPKIDVGGRNKKHASDVPVKYLLNMITDFGYLEVSPEVQAKRAERKANKPVDRNRSRMDNYGYDKSGYEKTGLKKYIDMLGEMGLSQYESILEDGFDAFDTLNSMLRKFSREEPDKIIEVNNLTSNFLQTLRKFQLEYNRMEQNTGDPELDRRYSKYARDRAKPYLLQLKKIIRDMKKFLDNEIMY